MLKKSTSTSERPPKRARVDSTARKSTKGTSTANPTPGNPAKSALKSNTKAVSAPAASPKPKTKAVKAKTKRPKADPTTEPLPTSFNVIAGSYEKLLYGLQGAVVRAPAPSAEDDGDEDTDSLTWSLKPIFIFPAHVSCIKAVAASPHGGKWLASGSADEIIKVWDLRRRKEIGGLMHHEGSITHLEFPSRSHLLSASEDGTLCLFRARDWAVLRTLKGHKGRVNSLAVHPSGKVALSVGKDRALRMWDLMRGKGAASTKLGKEGETVRWSTDGAIFAVQAQSTVDIYSSNMTLLHSITHPSRVHDVLFVKPVGSENDVNSGHLLLVGAEDKKLTLYNIAAPPPPPVEGDDSEPTENASPGIVAEMTGHTNRVKAVQSMRIALPPLANSPIVPETTIISTISSDGFVNVYDLSHVVVGKSASTSVQQISPVTVYDSKGTRLTCVALADGGLPVESSATTEDVGEKRKREDDAGSGEDDTDAEELEGEEEEVDETSD